MLRKMAGYLSLLTAVTWTALAAQESVQDFIQQVDIQIEISPFGGGYYAYPPYCPPGYYYGYRRPGFYFGPGAYYGPNCYYGPRYYPGPYYYYYRRRH